VNNDGRASAAGGCYQVFIRLKKGCSLSIGKLGSFYFPPGDYVYTGSAKRGLQARIERHRKKQDKPLHWHIDYLLASPHAEIKKIRLYPSGSECRLNRALKTTFGGGIVAPGFGSSDCRFGCGSHLLYFGKT
jgi:Uri superfamily endonuclease